MTEKRFTAVIYDDYEKSLFFDNERKEQSLTDNEILNLLNELNEELESREKAHTRCDELYRKLYDENEQLKSYTGEMEDYLARLEEKNEQLKKILNELSDMLQFDVENGIKSYPVILSEYLSNALKELQE